MKYRIIIRRHAEKELGRLGHDEQRRISQRILLLESEPFPVGAIALQGRRGYRIRIGDYRVLYEVDEATKIVKTSRQLATGATFTVDSRNFSLRSLATLL